MSGASAKSSVTAGGGSGSGSGSGSKSCFDKEGGCTPAITHHSMPALSRSDKVQLGGDGSHPEKANTPPPSFTFQKGT